MLKIISKTSVLFFILVNNIGLVVSMDSGKRALPPEPRQDYNYIKQLEKHLKQSEIRRLLEKIARIRSLPGTHNIGEINLAMADAFVQLAFLGYKLSKEERELAKTVSASSARCCISGPSAAKNE